MESSIESGAVLHPDLEKSASNNLRVRSNTPGETLLAGEADAEILGQ